REHRSFEHGQRAACQIVRDHQFSWHRPRGTVPLPSRATSTAGPRHAHVRAGSVWPPTPRYRASAVRLVPSRMLHPDHYAALLARGQGAGADFVEIYVERWRRRLLRAVDGRVEEATSSIERGAGVRMFFGEDVVYGYTNDVSEDALAELLASLTALRGGNGRDQRLGRPDAGGRGGLDLRKVDAGLDIHAPEVPFEAHDKRWRLERLREIDHGARIAPDVRQVDVRLLEWEQDVTVANSDGALVDDRRVRTRAVAQVIAADGDETQTGGHGPGLSVGLELFDRNPP